MEKIIIIGGGLGGLFTGALLAKEGYPVTVLEKNPVIGGGLQTFYRYGAGFESGMHLLGGLHPGQSIYKICRYLGIMDQLEIRDVDHDCMDQITYLSDGKTYRVPQGKEAFADYFSTEFPAEKNSIHAYVEALYQLVDEIDFFYLRTGNEHVYSHNEYFLWPADQFVNHFLKDYRLRDVISYMNPMFGGIAGHTPTYIHALINVLYIDGPSRFVGNSQQMADALAKVIEEGGGSVITRACVSKLNIEDRQLRSLQYEKDGQSLLMACDTARVIADVHPSVLLGMTDSKVFSKAYRNRIEQAPNSYSSFCVYVVFKPGTFPFINHTCYFQKNYGMVWHYNEYDEEDWPRGFLYMTPVVKGQGAWASTMIINCIMPSEVVARWAGTTTGHRGPEYEAWKQRNLDKVLGVMRKLYPGFDSTIAHVFASSPLTIRDYYNEPDGALYGLRKDCQHIAQSQVPVYTKVRNLLMTGQNVNLHGFCGVPLTAINTAEAIVGANKITCQINHFK